MVEDGGLDLLSLKEVSGWYVRRSGQSVERYWRSKLGLGTEDYTRDTRQRLSASSLWVRSGI